MKRLTTDQAIGNNLESYKSKRVTINLFNDPNASNQFAKYYFDEYPELQNKKIVGIKFNAGVIGGLYEGEDFQEVYNSLDNNIGQNSGYVDNLGYARYLFLNLYNKNNELIIQNFPLVNLCQNFNTYDQYNRGKIIPFDCYLNLKRSYIFSSLVYTGPTQESTVSLTFYYLDK
jgi:hypothetical protein